MSNSSNRVGQERTVEAMADAYERLSKTVDAFGEETAQEERTTEDPFGFARSRTRDARDPYATAKLVSDKLLNFLSLLIAENLLDPEEVIYAQELMALSTFNASDVKLTPESIKKARSAAYAYYQANS